MSLVPDFFRRGWYAKFAKSGLGKVNEYCQGFPTCCRDRANPMSLVPDFLEVGERENSNISFAYRKNFGKISHVLPGVK